MGVNRNIIERSHVGRAATGEEKSLAAVIDGMR